HGCSRCRKKQGQKTERWSGSLAHWTPLKRREGRRGGDVAWSAGRTRLESRASGTVKNRDVFTGASRDGFTAVPEALLSRLVLRTPARQAQPAAPLTTAASSSAAARVVPSSRPSTITRITGSVPEGRSTTRPSPAMRF